MKGIQLSLLTCLKREISLRKEALLCSRVPVILDTGPTSFCAGPRLSPGLPVPDPEYPVSP